MLLLVPLLFLVAYAALLFFLLGSSYEPREHHGVSSRGEAKCGQVLQQLFPSHQFKKVRPDWLVNSYPGCPYPPKRMELDLYCDVLKLAVEYDGEQHFKYTPYFHGPPPQGLKRFWGQQQRDQRKNQLCADYGVDLIRISYKTPINEIYTLLVNHPFVVKRHLN